MVPVRCLISALLPCRRIKVTDFYFPDVDKNGNHDSLRFPQFRPETIAQSIWKAADLEGRIRVVISEGLHRPYCSPPFERIKDIIAFSFQYAPLGEYILHSPGYLVEQSLSNSLTIAVADILEFSRIAWPNEAMWNEATWLPEVQGSSKEESEKGSQDFKALDVVQTPHAHSPVKCGTPPTAELARAQAMYDAWAYFKQPSMKPPPPRMALWQHGYPRGPTWPAPSDPFVAENFSNPHTKSDISMPDYPPSESSSSHEMSTSSTHDSYRCSKQPGIAHASDEELYQQFPEPFNAAKARMLAHHRAAAASANPVATHGRGIKTGISNAADETSLRAARKMRSGSHSQVHPAILADSTRVVSGSSSDKSTFTDADHLGPANKPGAAGAGGGKAGSNYDKGDVENKENETSPVDHAEDLGVLAAKAVEVAETADRVIPNPRARRIATKKPVLSGSNLGGLATEESANASGEEVVSKKATASQTVEDPQA